MGIDFISAFQYAYGSITSIINTLVRVVQYVIVYWDVLAPLFGGK